MNKNSIYAHKYIVFIPKRIIYFPNVLFVTKLSFQYHLDTKYINYGKKFPSILKIKNMFRNQPADVA